MLDFGCGYGTFTVPAARVAQGMVHALDIEPEMVRATARRAKEAGLHNVRVEQRDFVVEGTGLPDAAEKQILDRIRDMGTKLIVVNAGQTRIIAGRQRQTATVTTLEIEDADAIARQCPAMAVSLRSGRLPNQKVKSARLAVAATELPVDSVGRIAVPEIGLHDVVVVTLE